MQRLGRNAGLTRVARLTIGHSTEPLRLAPIRVVLIRHISQSTKEYLIRQPGVVVEPSESGRRTLYYHLLSVPTSSDTNAITYKWALSYSPTPPTTGAIDDKSILGALPAHQSEQTGAVSQERAKMMSIEYFEENPRFLETLQKAVRSVLSREEDYAIKAEAQARGEGWMHICDNRAAPALNRIPNPEDILGSVLVYEGKVVPDSYQVMPTYRVVSGESGPPTLSETIHERLMKLLEE